MSNILKGLKVTGPIITSATSDIYPTHLDYLGLGGYRTVNLISDLNKIPESRRKIGMLVYVMEDESIYILTQSGFSIWSSSRSIDVDYDKINADLLSLEKDLKLDLIKLRYELDAFSNLPEDYLILGGINDKFTQVKHLKLTNLPPLGSAKFPLFSSDLFDNLKGKLPDVVIDSLKITLDAAKDIPIPNPTFDPGINFITQLANITNISDIPSALFGGLSNYIMFGPWLPQIISGNPNFANTNTETVISSAVAMLNISIANIFKRFDSANLIVKTKKVTWNWDNPLYRLENIDPKIKAVMGLYNLTPEYNFGDNSQALEELLQDDPVNTGWKKGGVLALSNTADLKLAIPGGDFVDYKTNTFGPLCVIDVLASENSNKFISKSLRSKLEPNNKPINIPLQVQERDKNKQDVEEKDWEVLNIEKINVRHDLSYEELLDESYSESTRLLGYDYRGKLIPAKIGNAFYTVNNIADVLNTVNHISTLLRVVIGVSDTVKFLDITTQQAKNLNTIVKAIGGIKDATNMVDVKPDDAKKLIKTVSNVVGSATKNAIEDTLTEAATKAADVFTNKAALLEIEEQIAALAGVTAINTLWNLFNTIGIATTAITGRNYGEYIRGQTLNIKNSWQSTDLNDECANATGEFRPFDITPYKYENRGHGTLWFDSNGRKSKKALLDSDHPPEYYSKPGLRIFSWDSSSFFDNEIAPIHIGLFGYKKFATKPDEYKGFIFETEFDNNPTIAGTGVIFEDENPNYRFPTKFGLYSTHRTVSSMSRQRYGWDSKEAVFEYDYNSFNFYKPVTIQNLSVTKSLNIPVVQSANIPANSPTGAIFFCPDL